LIYGKVLKVTGYLRGLLHIMTDDNTSTDDEPTLPDKLAERIEQYEERTANDETIIANGNASLTSEHPVAVVEYFLATHGDQWADATFTDYSYDLTRLLEYFEYADIDDISTLTSRDIEGFRQWREQDGNILLSTLHGQLSNIRVFIKWCERVEIVEEGLTDAVKLPDLEPSDIVSHTRIDPETAAQIRDYYDDLAYVPRKYAMWSLMWSVLLRVGGLRSLDLDHYHREEGYIELHHRREEDTPLKNGSSDVEGEGGEREVNLPNWVCETLNMYIDGTGDPNHPQRQEMTDEYGRKPLFTSRFGRVSTSTVQREIYRITQPCQHGGDCPEELNPNTCVARNDNNKLSRCPVNTSPHPVRRGGICHQLNQGVPKQIICERADVSRRVLNRHYDLRTKQEAREQRRQKLQKHLDGYRNSDAGDRVSGIRGVKSRLADTDLFNIPSSGMSTESIENARMLKGTVGFGSYLLLLILDIWLIISPVAV
jgi:site-specific recombinase XerC